MHRNVHIIRQSHIYMASIQKNQVRSGQEIHSFMNHEQFGNEALHLDKTTLTRPNFLLSQVISRNENSHIQNVSDEIGLL